MAVCNTYESEEEVGDVLGQDTRVNVFVSLVYKTIGPRACDELVLSDVCDWCGSAPEAGRELVGCESCHAAHYCDATCKKRAWKGGVAGTGVWRAPHKRACSTREKRVFRVLELLQDTDCSRLPSDTVHAALDMTVERVEPAKALLLLLLLGGVPEGTTDDEVCRAMSLIFKRKCKLSYLRRIEAGLSPEVRNVLIKKRDDYSKETAVVTARMADVWDMCDEICVELRETMGGCMIVRYRPTCPEQPPPVHPTNRALRRPATRSRGTAFKHLRAFAPVRGRAIWILSTP